MAKRRFLIEVMSNIGDVAQDAGALVQNLSQADVAAQSLQRTLQGLSSPLNSISQQVSTLAAQHHSLSQAVVVPPAQMAPAQAVAAPAATGVPPPAQTATVAAQPPPGMVARPSGLMVPTALGAQGAAQQGDTAAPGTLRTPQRRQPAVTAAANQAVEQHTALLGRLIARYWDVAFVLGVLVPAASEYEITVARLYHTTGALGISSQELGSSFLSTRQDAVNALEAIRQFIPAGIQSADALRSFASAAFELGIFTGEGTAKAAKGFRDITVSLTDVGASSAELDSLKASVEGVTAVTGQSVEALGRFVRTTAVMADVAGISKEELLALGGAVTMLGEGGQQLGGVFNKLWRQMYFDPGALSAFMGSNQEFFNALQTEGGGIHAMRMFAEQIDRINTHDYFSVILLEQMGLSLSTDVPLLKEFARTWDKYHEALAAGASPQEAMLARGQEMARINNTLANSLTGLRGAFSNLATEMGEGFTPIIKTITAFLEGFLSALTAIPESQRQVLFTTLAVFATFAAGATAVAGIVSAFGALTAVLGLSVAAFGQIALAAGVVGAALLVVSLFTKDAKQAFELMIPAVVAFGVAVKTGTWQIGLLAFAFLGLVQEGRGVKSLLVALIPLVFALSMGMKGLYLNLTMMGVAVAIAGIQMSSMGGTMRVLAMVLGAVSFALGAYIIACVAAELATLSLAVAVGMATGGISLILGGIVAFGAGLLGTTSKTDRLREAHERLGSSLTATNERIVSSDRLLMRSRDNLLDRLSKLPMDYTHEFAKMVYDEGRKASDAIRVLETRYNGLAGSIKATEEANNGLNQSSFLHLKEGISEVRPSLAALNNDFGQIELMLKRIAKTTSKMTPPSMNIALLEGQETPKQIPMLRDPTFVDKPTLAIVGERGPEWVIPADLLPSSERPRTDFLPDRRGGAEDGFKQSTEPRIIVQPTITMSMPDIPDYEERATLGGGTAPTITITVPVMLDGRQIAEAVAKHEAVELLRHYQAPKRPKRGVGV